MLTRNDIAIRIMERTGMDSSMATEVLDEILKDMSDEIVRGGTVTIDGFGSIETKEYEARRGRDPKTGAEIFIEATHRAYFDADRKLRNKAIRA